MHSSESSRVQDPVCGKKVYSDSQFRVKYGDQEYIFCSRNCMARFCEAPHHYAAATRAKHYSCPMHPHVREPEPGKCLICGMTLQPVKTKWICPYHPELLHDGPGVCPIYGLPLVPDVPGRYYSCTRHPKVRQLESGKCPKCKMRLEPHWAPLSLVSTEWVCNQHPEIIRLAPGCCPQCGMELEPRHVPVEKSKKPGKKKNPGHTGGLDPEICSKFGPEIK
jgi:YHS domain-containing protein